MMTARVSIAAIIATIGATDPHPHMRIHARTYASPALVFCASSPSYAQAITNDPAALTSITRLVDRLTVPLTHLLYSVYDKSRHAKWRSELVRVLMTVVVVPNRACCVPCSCGHCSTPASARPRVHSIDHCDRGG